MQIIFIELVKIKLHNVAASSGQNSRYQIMKCSEIKNGPREIRETAGTIDYQLTNDWDILSI